MNKKKVVLSVLGLLICAVGAVFGYGYWDITREKVRYCTKDTFNSTTINSTPGFFHKVYGISPAGGSHCVNKADVE